MSASAEESASPRPAGVRAAARIAVVAACLAYIVGAPLVSQGFGLRHPYLRGWRMFGTEGTDVTQVRFSRVADDGARSPIDEAALVAAGVKLPKTYFDEPTARAAARKLCRTGRVHVELRDATRRGWETVVDETIACGE